jgi:hypothetical protein
MQLTPDDPRYLAPAPDDAEEKDICNEESLAGFYCSRWMYHIGDHAAHTPDGRQVYRWRKIE